MQIGTPRQQVSRDARTAQVENEAEDDSVVNALQQDLEPSFVGNASDPIGPTVVDSGLYQRANRFSPLTAEIEEEPLSARFVKQRESFVLRPKVAESDTDSLENPSIFGESEVHEDHVSRDAGGPAISEVRVTAAIRLGFRGFGFRRFAGHIQGQSPCDEDSTWILETSTSVCHAVGHARGQHSLFESE